MKPKRKLQFLGWICIPTLLLISCTTEPPPPTAEEAEKAVIAKETEALDNWSAGNPAEFAVNGGDDLTYFDDIGASTRMDGIEECNAYFASLQGMVPPHDYTMEDVNVQVYGNVAILTFQYFGTIEGETGPPWKATSVYNYRDGDWCMVHAHWSFKEPEPEQEQEPEQE